MTDNVTAGSNNGAGQTFTTDNWTGDPKGSSQIPATKIIWGSRDTTYIFTDDIAGQRLPVLARGPTGAFTNAATTITAGGTSQELLAAASRQVLWIWNPITATEPLYVNFTSSATQDQNSIPLEPGSAIIMQSPNFVSSEQVNVIAATTGHPIGCKWA